MLLRDLFEDLERTGQGKSAVVGWGRGMGHKGHMFLASSVITQAKQSGSDPYFVVSRTVGKDDPITPDEKIAIYKKVFPQQGHIFQTATEEMPDLTRVLSKLQGLGYTDVTVVVGADQVKALGYVKNYNGKPDKSGNIPFSFNTLNVISRQETKDPSRDQEGPRATPMRDVLKDPTKSEEEKFAIWRDAMSPELGDDEVRDLMNKAGGRMSAMAVPKKSKALQVEQQGVSDGINLKFKTIELAGAEIPKYAVQYFEAHNIDTHHQKFISNIRLLSNNKLDESVENVQIQPFIQTIAKVDSVDNIKIGDKFSVLAFEIRFAWKEIDAFGFIEPKEVTDINLHSDGTINYIKFSDGDRYPRVVSATHNNKPIVHTAYFNNRRAAEKALTFLTLKVPDSWDLDISNIQGSDLTVNKSDKDVAEATSAAVRMQRAADKQRAKSDASLARTPSSIPKVQPKKDTKTEDSKNYKNPCWKGYRPVGTKKKAGKTVPNCVPVSEQVENIMAALIERILVNEAIQDNKR